MTDPGVRPVTLTEDEREPLFDQVDCAVDESWLAADGPDERSVASTAENARG